MKNLISTIASIITISFLFISCSKDNNPVTPEEKQFSPEKIVALEKALDESLRDFNVPGVIVGIWSPEGQWIKAKGVSNLVTGEPMKTDNHFRIGSVTKTFIGTVVLKLVDEGKISLDASLASYLPEYNFPKANIITVRMLGNMTSGIYNFSDNRDFYMNQIDKNFNINYEPDSLVKIALKFPLNFEPGTQYEYSNTNTILLGLICTK